MKTTKNILYFAYHWLIAMPLLLATTLLVSLSTIILTPWSNHSISYLPARLWGRIACRLFFIHVEIKGLEHIQKEQSYIFAANHQSFYDIFVLYGWLPILFKWIMKSSLRKIPFVGAACKAAGHIFLDRESRGSTKHMLEVAREQLSNGISVIVFPEGTRTFDGQVGRFKRGAFLLATELKLPIIPITIDGAYACMKRNQPMIYPGTIHITLHPAINTSSNDSENQNTLATKCREIIIEAM